MTTPSPSSQLREFFDGWLSLAMPWVIASAVRYLIRRRRYYDRFVDFYHMNKMAIAVLTLFTGLEGRTVIAWLLRHAKSGGYVAPSWLSTLSGMSAEPLLTVSSVLAVAGALCWGRVASDMPITKPWTWFVMVASCLVSAWFAGMLSGT